MGQLNHYDTPINWSNPFSCCINFKLIQFFVFWDNHPIKIRFTYLFLCVSYKFPSQLRSCSFADLNYFTFCSTIHRSIGRFYDIDRYRIAIHGIPSCFFRNIDIIFFWINRHKAEASFIGPKRSFDQYWF